MPTDKTTYSPLPWSKEMIDGECWSVLDAGESRVITTDSGYYTKNEGDYDLICDSVNERDALLAKAELFGEMLGLLKQEVGDHEGDNPEDQSTAQFHWLLDAKDLIRRAEKIK